MKTVSWSILSTVFVVSVVVALFVDLFCCSVMLNTKEPVLIGCHYPHCCCISPYTRIVKLESVHNVNKSVILFLFVSVEGAFCGPVSPTPIVVIVVVVDISLHPINQASMRIFEPILLLSTLGFESSLSRLASS